MHVRLIIALSRRQDPGVPTEFAVLQDIHRALEHLCIIPDACVSI